MANSFASSGTLVGAALESAGYYYQSIVLDTFALPWGKSLATLFFVAAALVALYAIVIHGGFKLNRWFLIGPVLFMLATSVRTPVGVAHWRFGSKDYGTDAPRYELYGMLKRLSGIDTGDREVEFNPIRDARVSSLFAAYNRLVSESIDSVVNALVDIRKNVDAKFIVRSELYAAMHSVTIDDPNFQDFLHTTYLSSCRQVIEAAREVIDPRKTADEWAVWQKRYLNLIRTRDTPTERGVRYLAGIRAAFPELYNLAARGTTEQVLNWLDTKGRKTAGVDFEGEGAAAQFGAKFDEGVREISGKSLSCSQLWNFSFIGLYRYAEGVARRVLQTGEKAGVPQVELVRDLLSLKGLDNKNATVDDRATDLHVLYRTIAHYLLRNELNRTLTSSFMNRYASRGFEFTMLKAPGESDLAYLERNRVENTEWQERSKAMFLAGNLPLYQGLGLKYAGIIYPFFALLLLIPGRQSGFLLFFLVWLFLKLLTVGCVVVMFLEDVLLAFVTYGQQFRGVKDIVQLQPSMAASFYALKELDPTLHLGTVYGLVAAALTAIPLVISYLIVGSLRSGAPLIVEGMSLLLKPLGSVGSFIYGQNVTSGLRYRTGLEQEEVGRVYTQNAKEGFDRYRGTSITFPTSPEHMPGPIDRSTPPIPLDEMTTMAVDTAQVAGRTSARASASGDFGWMNAWNPLYWGAKLYNQLLTPANDLFERTLQQKVRSLTAIRGANLDEYMDSVPYDHINSLKIMQRSATAGAQKQLGIPWTENSSQRAQLWKKYTEGEQRALLLASRHAGLANAAGESWIGMFIARSYRPEVVRDVNGRIADANRAFAGGPIPVVTAALRTNVYLGEIAFPTAAGHHPILDGWGVSRANGSHGGLDIDGVANDQVQAVAAGTVIGVRNIVDYGNTMLTRHVTDRGNIYYVLYGHGARPAPGVVEGTDVTRHQHIMDMGRTGNATGDIVHVEFIHFDPQINGYVRFNPRSFMPAPGRTHRAEGPAEARLVSGTVLDIIRNWEETHR